MQIIRCPKRGHPHFETVNGCPCCRHEPKPKDEELAMQHIFFLAVNNPDPQITNIFFPPEPVNDAAEMLEVLEASEEVRRAVNAWLYA